MYSVTKNYGHDLGLSATFRQHRADSHCRFLHGYALAVGIEFVASTRDERGWVVDFGDLGGIKDWLKARFDHRTLIARDDPLVGEFQRLSELGAIRLTIVDAVGCEAFAGQIADRVAVWMDEKDLAGRVWLKRVTVSEHDGNSAAFEPGVSSC